MKTGEYRGTINAVNNSGCLGEPVCEPVCGHAVDPRGGAVRVWHLPLGADSSEVCAFELDIDEASKDSRQLLDVALGRFNFLLLG